MATASTQLKPTEKQDGKKARLWSSSVTNVREFTVKDFKLHHISLGKSGTLWASDEEGNMYQTDLQGKRIQKMQTNRGYGGYHTITQDGDLICTDLNNHVIIKITPDNTSSKFIKTGDWRPLSIHSSKFNGDILVGMFNNTEAKVTRYNKTGLEIQNINKDKKEQALYTQPHYITENINGDICVSDYIKQAVVVVDKSGQHRFSIGDQGSEFHPYGICTDELGHILVCEFNSGKVYIMNQDGQCLSQLLTPENQGILFDPYSVCVDDENNLWVGQSIPSTVTVYKYLHH